VAHPSGAAAALWPPWYSGFNVSGVFATGATWRVVADPLIRAEEHGSRPARTSRKPKVGLSQADFSFLIESNFR